jgi:predicted enzyme related to lactoylglutathione lyase
MRDIDDAFAFFEAAFVIENQQMSGWWTEKLVSALLW